MSKLIFGLKGKNKLDGKVSIYLPKKLLKEFELMDLKKIWGLKDSSEVVKFCISFYAFYYLEFNRELYEQLKYSKVPNEFFGKREEFRENITLKEFEEHFTKIEVLNWHLIVCLSKYEGGFEEHFDIIREIIRFSWDHLEKANYGGKEKVFKLGMTDIFRKNISNLKILHGNYSEKNLMKKCLEFYAYNVDTNKNSVYSKSYSDKYLDEANELSEISLELTGSLAETLNFKYGIVNDIQEIVAYNLMVFKNLFPERSINNGKIT
ncbi:hypothetical protein [Bacillus cereus]